MLLPKPLLLPIIEAVAGISETFEIVPISALTGDGVDLAECVSGLLGASAVVPGGRMGPSYGTFGFEIIRKRSPSYRARDSYSVALKLRLLTI